MSEFKKGDRIKLLSTEGFILSKNQRTGTVLGPLVNGRLVNVKLDNLGYDLSFRPESLEHEKPKKQAKVKFLGITILTIEGDL